MTEEQREQRREQQHKKQHLLIPIDVQELGNATLAVASKDSRSMNRIASECCSMRGRGENIFHVGLVRLLPPNNRISGNGDFAPRGDQLLGFRRVKAQAPLRNETPNTSQVAYSHQCWHKRLDIDFKQVSAKLAFNARGELRQFGHFL